MSQERAFKVWIGLWLECDMVLILYAEIDQSQLGVYIRSDRPDTSIRCLLDPLWYPERFHQEHLIHVKLSRDRIVHNNLLEKMQSLAKDVDWGSQLTTRQPMNNRTIQLLIQQFEQLNLVESKPTTKRPDFARFADCTWPQSKAAGVVHRLETIREQ